MPTSKAEALPQIPSEVPSEDHRVQVRSYYKPGSSRETKIGFHPSKVCRIKVVRRDEETGLDRVIKTRQVTKTLSRRIRLPWTERVLSRLRPNSDGYNLYLSLI